jgi:hypothetical protein
LIPFLFEKVKNVECSYLMLSEDEINILLRSEQFNIQENMKTQEDGIEKIK